MHWLQESKFYVSEIAAQLQKCVRHDMAECSGHCKAVSSAMNRTTPVALFVFSLPECTNGPPEFGKSSSGGMKYCCAQ